MSGARLNDPIISYHSGFEPDLVFGIDKIGTEWLNARKLRLRDIGNTYIQGSSNGITWSNFINSSHTYLRISTDGGITWRNLDADLLRDGVTNKFYTEAKVSANSSVVANTSARHTHANKALLDNLVTNGTGQNFLSDDGTYKNFQVITPLILDGDIFASGSITGGTFTDGVLSISNGFINNINGIDPVGYITFKDNPAPSYQPYRLFADTNNKTLSLYTSVPGTSLQIGLENWTYVYNNTGSTIINGKVVRINGASTGYPTIELASNDNFEHVQGLLGVTTHNIGTGEHGFVTTFGEVRDLNTSSFLNGSVLYLGTNGSIVNTRPTHPNYIIEIGICNNSDSINGKILVNTKGRVVDITENVFNGSFIDPMVFTVTSNGTTITGSLQRIGGGDLTINYSTGLYRLDCTPPVTITIPPGTDTTPLLSYVYIPVSTKVLTIGTSWPNTEHVKVSTVVAQSAATTQTRGILRNQNWNDNLADSTGEGQLSFINERLRLINAEWYSGVNPLLTIMPITAAPDNVYFSATSGKVYQLHLQDFPAISMPTNGVFVVNHNTTPYTYTTNLNTLLTTATGSSLSGKSFSFVIWGIQNEVGEQSHLMVNLPTGSYNTSADAILDVQGYSVYTIPTLYRGVGFLIARVTMSHSTSNGGTWTLNQTQDLRGYLPNNTAGGGAVGGGVGVSSLLQLSDVFASTYVGQAGKALKVNLGETGVSFEAELDPVFKAHTTYNISNGTGFLKNNGSGVWSYDNSTYLTTSEASSNYQPLDGDLTAIAGIVQSSGLLRKTSANNWTLDTNTYSLSDHLHTGVYEPIIPTGLSTQYYRGDKNWGDFSTEVRNTLLTGLSTSTNVSISDTDNILIAFGKLQAQINNRQLLDADLTAIAGLTGASGLLRKTAIDAWSLDTNVYLTNSDISNVVTASTAFGNDNRLLRSDGTGRGSQSSGITVDDSNNITGATNISGNSLQSTVATGTAPITVSSTTLVNNLNADLLDGYHASSFIQNHSVTNNYLLKSNGLGGISQSVIFDNGTNVGIGTTNPGAALQVAGDVYIGTNGGGVRSLNVYGGTIGNYFSIYNYGAYGGLYSYGMNNYVFANHLNGGYITFHTNNGTLNEAVRITSNGSVGIGLTNPSEKLDVNGNIKSSSLSGVGTRLVTANSSGVLGTTLNKRIIEIRLLDKDTSHTTGNTIGGDFRFPYAMTVHAVGMYIDTAGTTGLLTVDINESGTTILSTKMTIDSAEKTTSTAATAPVISDASIAADAIITFDIDGIHTTAGKGLTIWMEVSY